MHHALRVALACLPGLLLAACGGGEPEASTPTAVRASTLVPNPALAPLDISLLLGWSERTFPTLFPSPRPNLQLGAFTYRHYPETDNYVGVAGDDVYVLGAFSGWLITRVGSREDYRCAVSPTDCVASNYPRAGWTASLSRLAHGVAGQITIVDERTVRLSGFSYDGGGPAVYAYLGSEDTAQAYVSGRIIGPRLNRLGQPYVNATIELQLPQGQTLDGYTALSIWCADFRANFGSATFVPPAATSR